MATVGTEENLLVAEAMGHPRSRWNCPHFKDGRMLSFCSCPSLPRYHEEAEKDYLVLEFVRETYSRHDFTLYSLVLSEIFHQRAQAHRERHPHHNNDCMTYRIGDYSRALLQTIENKKAAENPT